MKKILSLILVAALILCAAALVACDGGDTETEAACTTHRDANDDGKCDTCGADFEDGDECTAHVDVNDDSKCDSCGTDFEDGDEIVGVECTFSVLLEDGTAVGGASFTLTKGSESKTLTSGDDGVVKATLANGGYTVEFDYDTLPSGFIPLVSEVEVSAEKQEITLTLRDNNPDGSVEKPFFISEDITEFSIEAGAELFYNYRGAAQRYLVITVEGISVNYGGETFEAVDGTVTVTITPQLGSVTSFSIKNNTGAAISSSFSLKSEEGSLENPIAIEGNGAEAKVPAEGAVYYTYTAEKSGVIVVSSENELNNISITNVSTSVVSAMTSGAYATYMAVTEGDVIKIEVASTDSENEVAIAFAVNCYAGTEADPVPLVMELIDVTFTPSATIYFRGEAGKTVVLSDPHATLTFDGQGYTPTELVSVRLTLEGEDLIFAITNNDESMNGIELEIIDAVAE